MPTVAQIFAHTLREIGIRYVFGVPSGNMIDYIEAIHRENGIDFVLVGHESTASVMADVCGRITGLPGVCFATFGPGATNLSTGVGGALLDRSPLLAFTDEMPDEKLNRTVQMNINHQQLFFPLTKWTTRLGQTTVEEIILKGAVKAASGVRGSVHIGIPAGIGQLEAGEKNGTIGFLQVERKKKFDLLEDRIEKVQKILNTHKKPLIAVGLTAVSENVKDLVLQLIEKFRFPVVLTPMAKGIVSEEHPLYAGVLFHALSDHVAETYREADVIVGIGYDPVELNYEDWMPEVPLVNFDLQKADVDELKIPKVLDVVGDLKTSLTEFLETEPVVTEWNIPVIQERKNRMFQKLKPVQGRFGPRAVLAELRKALPREGILTLDVGAHLHLAGQQWHTPEPQKLLMTNGWSSMGFALPAALAAKICYPDLPVAALMGDGGFYMTAGELATAKRLHLNIVFIVLYDSSLSLIRIKQEKKNFDTKYGTELNVLPKEPSNHYFGVPVIRVADTESFKFALNDAFLSDGPVVIEAVVDGSEYGDLVLKANK